MLKDNVKIKMLKLQQEDSNENASNVYLNGHVCFYAPSILQMVPFHIAHVYNLQSHVALQHCKLNEINLISSTLWLDIL